MARKKRVATKQGKSSKPKAGKSNGGKRVKSSGAELGEGRPRRGERPTRRELYDRKRHRNLPAGMVTHWRPRLLLRLRRLEKGWSQTELAKRLGSGSQSMVADWETGYKTPSWGSIAALAAVLGLKKLGELIDPESRFDQENVNP
jgi:ribosome-binding protein aMBF1 (putative translation factor)